MERLPAPFNNYNPFVRRNLGNKPVHQDKSKFTNYGPSTQQESPAVADAYSRFGAAAEQQGNDYSDIMSKFKDVYNMAGAGNSNLRDFHFTAQAPTYQTTQDYTNSFNNLSDLSRTGGFSPEDLASIRARAISPIRSVYANASRNIDRSRSLAGGYSPNYNATTAKMARSMSSQLSDASTDAEANIAEKVAQNKLASAGPLANLAASEQANRNDFALKSADFKRMLDEFKYGNEMKMFEFPIQSKLSAASGMAGLYGSTPGLTSYMGNNALSTADLQERINNNRSNKNFRYLDLFSRS